MITQAESQFRGRISSILQVFIEAAVTEICELIELEVATLRSELSCHSGKGSNVNVPREKLTLQSTEENIPSGSERGFESPDHTDTLPQNTADSGVTERKIFRNQETATTSHPCAVWNQRSGNEDTKNDSLEGCTELDISVKKEMLEDSHRHEGDTSGVDITLHGANEDMDTGLQWTNAEAATHASTKCDSKSEPVCDRSTQHDMNTWDSAVAEKHYTQSVQLAQDVDLQHEHEQEDEEQSSTYLANWTNQTSPPLKGPSQGHHSMQYMHEELNDTVEGLGVNLPPSSSDFHSVRVDLSGSHFGMSVHHSMSLEERFICPMCGKMLRSDRALRAHMKDHTTLHICNHCGKSFARLTNLRVHQNIHMGLKPYSCKYCSKKFSDPSNYNRHKHRCSKSVHT